MTRLRRDFEVLEMSNGESVGDYFARVMVIENDMRNLGEEMTNLKVVEKYRCKDVEDQRTWPRWWPRSKLPQQGDDRVLQVS